MSVGSAAAAQWKKSESGMAEVCFTSTGFDATAKAQAAIAAAQWDAVSTALHVTYATCGVGANEIPMTIGLRAGATQFGETTWTEQGGEFVSAEIQYNESGAVEWATDLASTLGDDAIVQVWLQLFCHEMGHALGLAHTTAQDSCMQTAVSTPFTKPGAGDKTALIALYGGTAKPNSQTTTTSTTSTSTTTSTITPVTIPAPTIPDDEGQDPTVSTLVTIPVIPIGSDENTGNDSTEDDGVASDDGTDDEGVDEGVTTSSTISTTVKTTSTTKKPSSNQTAKPGKNNDHATKHRCGDSQVSQEKVRKMVKAMRLHYKQEHQAQRQHASFRR
jgi:hypothetical protein